MPVRFEVHPSHRCVVVWFDGALTVPELVEFAAVLTATPGFERSFHSLYDARRADASSLQVADMRSLAAKSPFGDRSKRAFVVDTDLQFGMIRVVELSTDGASGRFKFFADPAEAARWIGLPPELVADSGERPK